MTSLNFPSSSLRICLHSPICLWLCAGPSPIDLWDEESWKVLEAQCSPEDLCYQNQCVSCKDVYWISCCCRFILPWKASSEFPALFLPFRTYVWCRFAKGSFRESFQRLSIAFGSAALPEQWIKLHHFDQVQTLDLRFHHVMICEQFWFDVICAEKWMRFVLCPLLVNISRKCLWNSNLVKESTKQHFSISFMCCTAVGLHWT